MTLRPISRTIFFLDDHYKIISGYPGPFSKLYSAQRLAQKLMPTCHAERCELLPWTIPELAIPDHKPGKRPKHGYDWFALGGVLVKQEDEQETRRLHTDFCARWSITAPIHSVEIRGKTKEFLWLRGLPKEEQDTFFEELYQLMRAAPVVGLACVIDRPGYNDRYRGKYGDQRWMLCKTAFNIAVERAAKFARGIGYRLRVAPERCNKAEDGLLSRYYYDLKTVGMPFCNEHIRQIRPAFC